jgi:hypothetical protein
VFNGTVKTILSFTIDGDKIVPYSAQVGSIIVYYKAQKVLKVHKKTNVINNQKISDKAEKPWYKFWDSDDDSKDNTQPKKQTGKKEVNKKAEKPWYKFW